MKSWVVLVSVACVGIGVGIGFTIMDALSQEQLFLRSDFQARADRQRAEEEIKRQEPTPKIEFTNGRVYDFGSMERMGKRSHKFLLKNVGDAPLIMRVNRTTCKCTITSLDGQSIMPGETGEVDVEWTGKTPQRQTNFKQGVELGTNDPSNEVLSLVIKGYVTETLRVYPPEVVVGRVSSNTGTEAQFQLFGYLSDEIEVLETGFEDAASADQFEIAFEPLSPEEVAKEEKATCGLLAKVTIKSGLPLGPINQTIRIKTRVDKEATVYVFVTGTTAGDIMLASSATFEARNNLLNFGPLLQRERTKAELQIFVKGEHRHDTKFSIGEVEPAGYLNVSIGDPEELGNGKTLRYKVTVEIPPGLEPINRLGTGLSEYRLGADVTGYGRIVLETTHPITKQIPIRVRFAVDK